MRRGIVSGKHVVKGKHSPEIKILLLAKLAGDFVHMPIDLLQQALVAIKHRIQSRLIACEVSANEFFKCSRVSVLLAPELKNLMQPTLEPDSLLLSILCRELALQFRCRVVHP